VAGNTSTDMPARVRARGRRTPGQVSAEASATSVARRLGAAVRAARRARGLRQSDAAGRAGLAQSSVSEFERGLGASFSLAAIARLAQAVGQRLYAGLEAVPGADPPRDAAHLAIQELVLRAAEPGPWRVLPEAPLERGERSIDVRLLHRTLRVAVVAEIWTWFADVGEASRGLDRKVAARARELDRGRDIRSEPPTVVGL